MRICVLSRDNSPIGFLDNDIPSGIKYWDDTLHVYLTGTANTFTFTTTATEESVELLAVGNKLSFIYNDRPYYMNIMTTSQTEQTLEIEAWAFFLELTNEIAYDYSGTSLTFVQYFNGMIYSKEMFEIGTNEISDKKLTLEYDSDETLLARLYSLAEDFEVELEFLPELESDYSLKKVKLNVYKKHSDTNQGVGEKRTDAHYYYDKNVTGITKKLDISNLYTSVCLTGKDGLTLSDMETTTVLDDDGNVLYAHYKGDGGFVRAPQAMQQFPAHVSGSTDKYIAYYGDTDDETVDALYKSSLEKIKEVSVPDSTYEISGVIDVNIGDTITIVDGGFSPTLILETRVTEQEISFTDSTRNSTTFENTKELESKINDTLVKRVEELAVEATAAANSSVVSSVTEYYLSTSATSQTGGSWSTTSPTWSEGTYVWTRTKTTTKGGTVSYSNAACVTGNTGAQGEQGIQGESGAKGDKGDKGDTGATGAKGDKGDTGAQGIQGIQGEKGDKGDTGAQGTSVTKTYTQYYLSTSNTTQTGGSWSNTMPTWSSGKYIWQREITVLSTGSTVTGTAVLANGLNSANQTANTANTNASSAISTANTANTNATNAVSTANTANTNASTAVSTANTAKTTADTANTNASKAVTTANSASTTASEAKTTADTANTNASNAVTTANTANSTANAAKTTATNAQTTANTAKTTADTAKTTADTAKAATDTLNTLIRETTDGVEVAKVDDTGAYTGMRTEQTADAYLIKDKDGNTLASYGADTVELGKNSENAVIKMCENGFWIRKKKIENRSYFTLNARNVKGDDYDGGGDVQIGIADDRDSVQLSAFKGNKSAGFMLKATDEYGLVLIEGDNIQINGKRGSLHVIYSDSLGNLVSKLYQISISDNDLLNIPTISDTSDTLQPVNLAYLTSVLSDYLQNTTDNATALSNGLGLSNCAFYHRFGVTQTAITGGWNNFTTTNINVPAASLGTGTYLVMLSICLTGQGTGYCQALWWLNGAEAISYGFQERNSCYVANGKDSYFNLVFLWRSDGSTNFVGYPRLESNVYVKPWRASVALIRLNNGTFTAK